MPPRPGDAAEGRSDSNVEPDGRFFPAALQRNRRARANRLSTSHGGHLLQLKHTESGRFSGDITGDQGRLYIYSAMSAGFVGMLVGMGAAFVNLQGDLTLYALGGLVAGGLVGAVLPRHRVWIEVLDHGIAIDRRWMFGFRTRTVFGFEDLEEVEVGTLDVPADVEDPSNPRTVRVESLVFLYRRGQKRWTRHRGTGLDSDGYQDLVSAIRGAHHAWVVRSSPSHARS